MRNEGHGWDPKAPASVHRARAALDKDGNVIALEFWSRGFSRLETNSTEADPGDTLAGMLLGHKGARTAAFNLPENAYTFREQAAGLGNRRGAASGRFASAHLAYARSAGPAGDLCQRILHRRSGLCGGRRSGGIPPEISDRAARPGGDPGGRRKGRLETGTGRRAAHTARRSSSRGAASPISSAAARLSRSLLMWK